MVGKIERRSQDCNNKTQVLLSLITTFGFFGCLFFLLSKLYPTENKDLINTMMGSLGTIWVLQMQFFFGSSASNKSKDNTISRIAGPSSPSVTAKTESGDVNLTTTPTKDNKNEKPVT